jgi:ABC-type transport system involved in multi-copper enzyme maturation permease subunit
MSASTLTTSPAGDAPVPETSLGAGPATDGTWDLWRRQVLGVLRLEIRKTLKGARAVPLLLLAGLPVVLLVLFALAPLSESDRQSVTAATIYAYVFRFYYLKVGLFLGSLVVSLQLFRGDILDRSLHYYLLCPVRREVLVAAKFLVGVVTTSAVLAASTAASYLVLHAALVTAVGPGEVGTLLVYVGITVLGCIGYGAVFMLAGLFFKNPVVPALGLFLWELINPFLPALLKKASVIHYLVSLLPVPVSASPFQVLATETSPWISVPGLLLVTAASVYLAGFRLRRMEIQYSEE